MKLSKRENAIVCKLQENSTLNVKGLSDYQMDSAIALEKKGIVTISKGQISLISHDSTKGSNMNTTATQDTSSKSDSTSTSNAKAAFAAKADTLLKKCKGNYTKAIESAKNPALVKFLERAQKMQMQLDSEKQRQTEKATATRAARKVNAKLSKKQVNAKDVQDILADPDVKAALNARKSSKQATPTTAKQVSDSTSKKSSVERDAWGAKVGTQISRINAAINTTPMTAKEIAAKADANLTATQSHLRSLVNSGHITHGEGGYVLVSKKTSKSSKN
jgi:hypothetical protein